MVLVFMMATLQGVLSKDSHRDFKRAEIALQKIEDLERNLTAFRPEEELAIHNDFQCEFKRLDLIDVTHSYQREREIQDFIVGPVNLSLLPGEVVFLVGGNGSGKTTLAKLLVGLYVPEAGKCT